jgi:predicted HD superfamily hydrolase involved in NAD metabolism
MNVTPHNIQSLYTKFGVGEERARHSLGVAEIATELAKINNISVEKAWLAGALHDLARDWDSDRKEFYTKSHDMTLTEEEKQFSYLTHGKIAANIAKEELDISDTETLLAMSTHTAGDSNMSVLQEIIYAADFMDSTRDLPELQAISQSVYTNLRVGINLINNDTFEYLKQNKKTPSKAFLRNLDYYSKYI